MTESAHVSGDGVQPRAVIVGDSLTGGNTSYIKPVLAAYGLGDVRVEGLSARRIARSYTFDGYRDSGIERVRNLKAAGVKPQLWVIQLGTNDLGSVKNCACADPVAFAGSIIDQLLAEIGPGVPIAWVTVLHWSNWGVAESFNQALRIRAAADPWMAIIRWKEYAAPHPEWFADNVHPNTPGVVAFTGMYVGEISALLDDPLGQPWSGAGNAPATRLGPPD
jgi:lysophospholipase L1-like esterase